jgi:hypothetical protein
MADVSRCTRHMTSLTGPRQHLIVHKSAAQNDLGNIILARPK